MIFRSLFTFLLAAIAGLVSCFALAQTPPRLLLATYDWAPYHYQEQGEMKGKAITLMQCVMEDIGLPYQLLMTNKENAELLVDNGQQDAIFLTAKVLSQGEKNQVSLPIFNERWSWFSLSDSTDFNSIAFKDKFKVAALFGSPQWFWLHDNGYEVVGKAYTAKALVDLMLQGRVGAILANEEAVVKAILKLGINHIAISKKFAQVEPLAVYFSKTFTIKYPLFIRKFNQALKRC